MAQRSTKSRRTTKGKSSRAASQKSVPAITAAEGGVSFEVLETRQMMSVVNISDYGAKAGANNTAAIQAAINASKSGDTVNFDGINLGTVGKITLASGRTYNGAGASLTSDGSDAVFSFGDSASNITIENFTFTGRAINGTGSGAFPANITVENNTFTGMLYNGQANPASIWEIDWTNSTISSNTFTSWGDGGVEGFGFANLNVTGNHFSNGNEGVHIDANAGIHTTLNVSGNLFENMHRMCIELQSLGGGAASYVVDDNVIKGANPIVGQDNTSCFGISVATDMATSVQVERNWISSYERPDGIGMRIGIELAADPGTNGAITCTQNYIRGTNCSISLSTSLGAHVYDNNIAGELQGPVSVSFGRNANVSNNGANVTLDWDTNRAWPISGTSGTGTGGTGTGGTGTSGTGTSGTGTSGTGTSGTGTSGTGTSGTGTSGTGTSGTGTSGTGTTGTSGSGDTGATGVSSQPGDGSATSTTRYISDLGYTVLSNGWGPAAKNQSNGEQSANDGTTLTLNGKTYSKGLGVHAPSAVQISLAGQYTTFQSDIGLDDEIGNAGDAEFQVYGDGKLLYDSGSLTGASATKSIDISVKGIQTLLLKVISPTGDIDSDHADWADARLTLASTASTGGVGAGKGSSGAISWLSDVGFTTVKDGHGQPGVDLTNPNGSGAAGKKMVLGGKTYAKGVGTAASSDLQVALDGNYTTFASTIGLDQRAGKGGAVDFQIWADGKELYDSGTMTSGTKPKSVSVNVKGDTELTLRVLSVGNTTSHDYADWAGAKLVA